MDGFKCHRVFFNSGRYSNPLASKEKLLGTAGRKQVVLMTKASSMMSVLECVLWALKLAVLTIVTSVLHFCNMP